MRRSAERSRVQVVLIGLYLRDEAEEIRLGGKQINKRVERYWDEKKCVAPRKEKLPRCLPWLLTSFPMPVLWGLSVLWLLCTMYYGLSLLWLLYFYADLQHAVPPWHFTWASLFVFSNRTRNDPKWIFPNTCGVIEDRTILYVLTAIQHYA